MFVRLLPSIGLELVVSAMQSLTVVACYTSQDFQMFIPLIARVSLLVNVRFHSQSSTL